MELIFAKNIWEEKGIEVVFYPVLQDVQNIERLLNTLSLPNTPAILKRMKKESFSGKVSQSFVFSHQGMAVVLIGTGQKNKYSLEDIRMTAGLAVKFLQGYQAGQIGIDAGAWLRGSVDAALYSQAMAEGLSLAAYTFEKYKKPSKDKIKVDIKKVFVQIDGAKRRAFQTGWQTGLVMSEATNISRDLVNEPAITMTPDYLADMARDIAKKNKNIRVKILDRERAAKMGMHAFLGVAEGSDKEPRFIHLVYKPSTRPRDRVAIVGKGITFDSGGLNIKPGDSMQQMKIDMGGAATVLGVFSALGELKPKVEVHGVIAACENMPSGKALRPGDIVKNMQGKSIEIGNTDAEGRVTLADSLAYAQKQGVSTIVDLATLTGAVMVALGPDYAGFFCKDNNLIKGIFSASHISGEKIWQLPLPDEYKKLNDSKVADICNIPNTRYGGAITAALFLQEFITEKVAWAHLDIAGPAYAEKEVNSYTPVGGVGFGVRTLLEWIKNI